MKKSLLFLVSVVSVFFSEAQLPNINLVLLSSGFNSPIDIKSCGDNRLFVVEQDGLIRILSKSGVINATPFLTLDSVNSSGNEQGLLSVAFSPTYKQDGFFYVNYIFNDGTSGGATRISRFNVSPTDSNLALANSEKVLLTFAQPFTNHKGASLFFGKDGYLYDTQGDGGSQNDPNGNGQNKNVYLAKMLRIDVSDPDTTYTIPSTNPFVGQANTKGEIWAYGLRNPWRCGIDRITGDVWIGDVGQGTWEEVDFLPAGVGGQNCGWKCREGAHNYMTAGCVSTGFTDPVFEYNHSYQTSCSITGGYIYRGTQYNGLWAKYLCVDYCNGIFFSVKQTGSNTFDSDTLNNLSDQQYTSFGEDNFGELYVAYRCSTATCGKIYRLTETTDCKPNAFISMSDTIEGCNPVTVSALRGDTLSYQWYNTNGIINGASSYQYTTTQSGWYRVKVSKTLHAGCEAMSDSVFVLVHDTTVITPGSGSHIFCENNAPVSLNSYLSPSGGTYSGLAVSNNTFSPGLLVPSTTSLLYTYTNQYTCVSHGSVFMQVNDTTTLVKNNPDSVFCSTEAGTALSGFYNFQGIFSGNGVANDNVTFNPAIAGAGTSLIHYLFTDIEGCQSVAQFNLTVGDSTEIATGSGSHIFCENSAPVSLTPYLLPTGGTYSGLAVSNNIFTPAQLVPNSTTLLYTYTNQYGCVSNGSTFVQVNDTTALAKNLIDSTFCMDESPVSLTGFFNFPGAYSGNGVANDDSTFSPASAGAGFTTIQYQFTDIEGCHSSAAFNLEVFDKTALNVIPIDTLACSTDSSFSLTADIFPMGGNYSGPGVSGNIFYPPTANLGTNMIVYTYTNSNGCVSRDSFAITVSTCLGIAELKGELSFSVFPNPNNGIFFLNVQVNSVQTAELTISDALGKICYRKNQLLDPDKPVIAIEPTHLAKGIYSVQLKSGNGSVVRSLVVE